MNTWVVFDPLTGGFRAYDVARYTGPGTTGYVSEPGTVDEAREARVAYEAERSYDDWSHAECLEERLGHPEYMDDPEVTP